MSDIFISYSSQDRARAKVLAGALERQGWSVWWDRRIPPGKQFSQVIKEAVDEAKCVIVLWSKESVKSEWVQNEASEGARRKILVPALIDDVEMPFEFRRIQAARLVDWEEESPHPEFDTLLESVRAILGQPLSPQRDGEVPAGNTLDHAKPTGEGTQKGGNMSQKTKVLAAVCIVALITIISVGLFLKGGQSPGPEPVPPPEPNTVLPIRTYRSKQHYGRIHSGCVGFEDEEKKVSGGSITKVEVAYGGVIYGIRLSYGGVKGDWHLGPEENELARYGIQKEGWDVPEGEKIVRVEGGISGNYISWLKFTTNNDNSSPVFGEAQGKEEKYFSEPDAPAAKGLPLRTITGHVNKVRHKSAHNKRAIAAVVFEFGEPKGLSR